MDQRLDFRDKGNGSSSPGEMPRASLSPAFTKAGFLLFLTGKGFGLSCLWLSGDIPLYHGINKTLAF